MRNFRWLVVWVFAVLILGCGDDPIVNPDITPDENMPLPGRIAFASDRDGDFEIYMINADGTSLVRLTESKGVDYPSSWSPDGRKLAFVSNRSGSYNIYVMSVDGSEPTVQLTLDSEGTGSPNWSPDGRKLTFVTERRDSYNTYIISVGGSESTVQITQDSESTGSPSWSPDGRRIAFSSARDGNGEIYVVDPDGKNLVRLTNSDAHEYTPSWSPDSQQIVFARYPSLFNQDSEICVMDADGNNARQLTDNDASDFFPVWSPDGATIVFTSRSAEPSWVTDSKGVISMGIYRRRYDADVYVMNADGSDITQLTHDNISGGSSWSPDGDYIAFSYGSKTPYLKSDIYVMNANGGRGRALIDWQGSNEGIPIWGPLQ